MGFLFEFVIELRAKGLLLRDLRRERKSFSFSNSYGKGIVVEIESSSKGIH